MQVVKMLKHKERIVLLLDTGATAKKIATVISMGLALGPMARLWIWSLYHQAELWQLRGRKMELTPESMCKLHFQKRCLEESSGQPIWPMS